MPTLRLKRPTLAPGTVTVTFARPRSPPVVLGTWRVSRRGMIDGRGPPALCPELADALEVQLALGRLHGAVRGDCPGMLWYWRYFTDSGGA